MSIDRDTDEQMPFRYSCYVWRDQAQTGQGSRACSVRLCVQWALQTGQYSHAYSVRLYMQWAFFFVFLVLGTKPGALCSIAKLYPKFWSIHEGHLVSALGKI